MNCRGMQEPRHGLTAQPGQPMSLCARVCFARSYLFGRAWWHVKPVSLILGTALIDPNGFYRGVQVRDTKIANGTGHVKYELAHTHGSCQGFRGNKHLASECAHQEKFFAVRAWKDSEPG